MVWQCVQRKNLKDHYAKERLALESGVMKQRPRLKNTQKTLKKKDFTSIFKENENRRFFSRKYTIFKFSYRFIL